MKTLLVGCGSIGSRHLRNLRHLGLGPVACFDVDPSRAAAAARDHEATAFTTLDAALAWSPTIAIVCTPTDTHLDVARRCLANAAHVFVEKPLSHRVDGLEAFEAAAVSSGRVVLVACNMRFHAGVRSVRETVASGRIGKPQIIRAHFAHYLPNWRPTTDYQQTYSADGRRGGGIVLEAIHEIDYVRLLDGDLVDVHAAGGSYGNLSMSGEDVAVVTARTIGGAFVQLSLDCLRPLKSRGCEVIGSEGSVRWLSEGRQPERLVVEWSNRDGSKREEILRDDTYDGNAMYRAELEHFLSCVNTAAQPEQDVHAAAHALRIALAVQAQLTTNTVAAVR